MKIHTYLVMPSRGFRAYTWVMFNAPRVLPLATYNAVFNATRK
jgi:hypothetical protein